MDNIVIAEECSSASFWWPLRIYTANVKVTAIITVFFSPLLVLCALKARDTSLYIHHLIWVHAYSYLDAVFENRLKIIYRFELKHIAVPTGRFQIIVSCKCLDMMFKRMPRKVVQDSYVKVQHCICCIKRIDSSKLFSSYF